MGTHAFAKESSVHIKNSHRGITEEPGLSRRFVLMADAVPILISYVDADQRYRFNNRTYENWFESSRERLYGKHLKQVLGDIAYRSIQDHVNEALSGKSVHFQSTLRYKTAGTRYVDVHYLPDRNEEGKVVGFYALIYDLTERRETEEKLRTQDAGIRDIQRFETIGQIAAGIAHDFNNLISAVTAGCRMIEKVAEDCNQVRILTRKILETAQRGASLTKQLTSMSRSPGKAEDISVDKLIFDLAVLLRHLLGPHIKLLTILKSDTVRVRIDPGELQRVIINLVTNAKDAIGNRDAGTVKISTLTGGSPDNSQPALSWITISISDTGCGMSEETLRHAREMYYTTKGHGQGTGLGLPVSIQIIEAAGGQLKISSVAGKGTDIVLYLPVFQTTNEKYLFIRANFIALKSKQSPNPLVHGEKWGSVLGYDFPGACRRPYNPILFCRRLPVNASLFPWRRASVIAI